MPTEPEAAYDPERPETMTERPRPPRDPVEELLDEVHVATEPRPLGGPETLSDRVAIVTGGSTGIGAAIALELARVGVHVALTYLAPDDREEAEAMGAAIRARGVRTLVRRCDVCDPSQVGAFVDATLGEFGDLHVLW